MALLVSKRWGAVTVGLLVPLAIVVGWGFREWRQPYPHSRFTLPVTFQQETRPVQIEMFQPGPNSLKQHPTILIFHGVEGPHHFRRERYQTAATLAQQGYRVFIVHYMNGLPYHDLYRFNEQGELDLSFINTQREQDDERWVLTVKQVLRQLVTRDDVDPQRIAFYGNSMGGFLTLAVAADLACEQADCQPDCLIVNWGAVWPETTIPSQFPPTLFVHGANDTIVEPKWAHYSVNKIREAQGTAELLLIPGAGHIAQSPAGDAAILNILAKHLR